MQTEHAVLFGCAAYRPAPHALQLVTLPPAEENPASQTEQLRVLET